MWHKWETCVQNFGGETQGNEFAWKTLEENTKITWLRIGTGGREFRE